MDRFYVVQIHWVAKIQLLLMVPIALLHVRLFVTPWIVAHQAPLSMGILQAPPGLPTWPPIPLRPWSKEEVGPRGEGRGEHSIGSERSRWAEGSPLLVLCMGVG